MFFFLLFGRGPRPRPNSKKKNTPPPKQQKKKHASAPSERVFLLFERVGVFIFFAVWAGGVFFFCCLGGGMFLFLLFGRGRVLFFAVWAGGVFFFLLFGPGACFFFAVWAGDGSSLTYPSAWLVFKRPNNKRDRTAKKKHGFPTTPKPSTPRAHKTPKAHSLYPPKGPRTQKMGFWGPSTIHIIVFGPKAL